MIHKRTDALAASSRCVIDEQNFRMFLVDKPSDMGPIDFTRYQAKIDELKNETPTLFVTRDQSPLPTGLYNLGLRRAGDVVDISKVAQALKNMPPFVSGGGHPFAGGAQSPTLLTQDQVIDAVGAAATQSLGLAVVAS